MIAAAVLLVVHVIVITMALRLEGKSRRRRRVNVASKVGEVTRKPLWRILHKV
jgi:hypothetical protein